MVFDQETARSLYKKLLTLYPRTFRERLGESMEQTFNDLCNERKRRTERGFFGFVLLTFIETAIGIIREHILSIKQRNIMNSMTTSLRPAAIISLILILPFAILEFIYNSVNRQNIASLALLFGLLWLLPTAFIAILMPIVSNIRTGNSVLANPLRLVLSIALLLFIAVIWGSVLLDQLPCFVGVPKCD